MAYSSSNPLTHMDSGFASNYPRTYSYQSTHNSTDILATGFFAACGDGGRSANNVGLRPGDVVMNRASTSASIPGRVSMHSVIVSTPNVLSTLASSAFTASMGYDCSVGQSS